MGEDISKLFDKISILQKELESTKQVVTEQHELITFNAKLACIGELAGNVAHEINNPVAILEGQLRRLKFYLNDLENPNVMDLIEKMEQNNKRVVSIIRGLEKLSKDSDNYELTEIDLCSFFEEFIDMNYLRLRDSTLKVSYPGLEDELFIIAKEISLTQILTNLINNSIDVTKLAKEQWVKITVETDEVNKVKIRVTDSGTGIDNKIVDKLFDPFFTTKDKNVGSGVGLGVSKKLCEKMNADLYYELHEGNTSFVISFNQVNLKKL